MEAMNRFIKVTLLACGIIVKQGFAALNAEKTMYLSKSSEMRGKSVTITGTAAHEALCATIDLFVSYLSA